MCIVIIRVFFVIVSIFLSSEVFSQSDYNELYEVNSIEIQGNGSTKTEALVEILPRELPTKMTNAEIDEYARRVKNLGIFDLVNVKKVDNKLMVEVRRKTTLSPIIALSTGKTLRDTSGVFGLNEYDFLGNGTNLGAKASYNDRNLNFSAWIKEHNYQSNRWTRELEVSKLSSSFRFNDTGSNAWTRNRLGAAFEIVSPFSYDSPLLYEIQLKVYSEDFTNVTVNKRLNSATYIGSLFEVIYDRFKWDDLNPNGFKGAIEVRPGVMSNGEFRGEALAKFIAATPLAEKTSLVMNGDIAIVNSGNVNHSLLIGSQSGVRGLDDSFYRNSALSYLNLEVRHSVEMMNRIFVQPVLFMDTARFLPMDTEGNNQKWINALSTGVGVRVIPTGFTNLLFRADIARLHVPYEDWLFQVGFSQYF